MIGVAGGVKIELMIVVGEDAWVGLEGRVIGDLLGAAVVAGGLLEVDERAV